MKNLAQIMTITLFGFIIMGCGSNDTDSLEKLGKTVVSSLQGQDIETYLSLCGTSGDEIEYFKSLRYPDSLKEMVEKEIASLEKECDSRDQEHRKQRTEEFYELAKDRFWSNAEIVRIEVDSIRESNIYMPKFCKKITVYFKGHEPLTIREAGKFQGGWKIVENHPLRWE